MQMTMIPKPKRLLENYINEYISDLGTEFETDGPLIALVFALLVATEAPLICFGFTALLLGVYLSYKRSLGGNYET